MLAPTLMALVLLVVSQYNFLLFHTLAEFFAIVIAILMLVVAWHMYPFTRSHYLLFLGCGYFWIGALDLSHTLHYKGMHLVEGSSGNASTQFWIMTRYLEALILLLAPVFLTRAISRGPTLALFGVIAAAIIILQHQGLLPTSYIEGKGLTQFKVVSEYIIIAILVAAILALRARRNLVDERILNTVTASIVLTICAEMAFTFYVGIYDLSNILGHIFKLFSFWLIFIAMIRTTLEEPFMALSRDASTYDAVPDATILVDADGIVRQANQRAGDLAGMISAGLIGLSSHDQFHPGDDKAGCPVCRAVEDGSPVHSLELRHPRHDKWFEFSLSHVGGKGGQQGMVEVIRDVTPRMEAEESYSRLNALKNSIVDNLPLMLFVKDAKELRYVEWNKAAEELTGLAKADMVGRNDYDFWAEEEAEFFIAKDREVLDSGELLDIPEEPISTPFGQFLLHTRKIPIYDEQGNPSYLLGISEDITHHKEMEQALQQSQKMEAMGKLSGGIAHDYNNMLGVMQGYGELLALHLADNPKLMAYVEAIQHANERGTALTRKLLAFSRTNSSEESAVDINDFLTDERNILEKTLTARIVLEFDLQDRLWPVWLNLGDLEDSVINMVINAMHAIDESGSLRIATRNTSFDEVTGSRIGLPAGDYVSLQIRDDGCGIPQQTLARIFEPFYSTKGERGTGLGLSQVYGFVKRSHGAIDVQSTVGGGTTMGLYFPRHLGSKGQQFNDSGSIKSMPRGEGLILVVDDEPALAILASEMLKMAGYRVLTAESAAQALELLAQQPVDLLLSDIIMPDMNGYQLAEQVKLKYPQVKIQLVSGYSNEEDLKPRDSSLVSQILYKPFTSERLLGCIRELLAD